MFRAKWTPDVRLPRSGKWRRSTRTASHMEGTRLREKADEENWTAVPRLGCRCGFLRGFLRHIESVVTFCQNKGLFGRKLKTESTVCGNRRTVEGRGRHEKYSGRRFARLPPASAPLRAPQTKSAGNDRLARRHGRRTQGARPDTSPFAEFTPPPLAIVLPDLARRRPLVFLPPPSNWRDRAFDPPRCTRDDVPYRPRRTDLAMIHR